MILDRCLDFFQQEHYRGTYLTLLPLEVLEIIYLFFLQKTSLRSWEKEMVKIVRCEDDNKKKMKRLEDILCTFHHVALFETEESLKSSEEYEQKRFLARMKKYSSDLIDNQLLGISAPRKPEPPPKARGVNEYELSRTKESILVKHMDYLLRRENVDILFAFYKHRCLVRSTIIEHAQQIPYDLFTEIRKTMDAMDNNFDFLKKIKNN